MNKHLLKLTILAASAIFFIACGSTPVETVETEILDYSDGTNLTDLEYYYSSTQECEEVLFTCPQLQYPFLNDEGCGCGIPTDDAEVSDKQRTLKYLVKSYISHKVFPQKVGTIYETISELLFLTSEQDFQEEYTLTDYEIWAEIEQYEVLDGEVILLNKYSGPIELQLKEFGLNYAIEGHNLYPDMDEKELAENFFENSLTWILDQDPERPSEDIKAQMQGRLLSQVEGFKAIVEVFTADNNDEEEETSDAEEETTENTDPEISEDTEESTEPTETE